LSTVVVMPKLSGSMESGVVTKWRVAVGDRIVAGQIIADIETDKSVLEYESPESGAVMRLIAEEGAAALPVGAPMLELSLAEEDSAASLGAPAPPTQAAPLAGFSSVRRAIASKVSESNRTVPHFYASFEMRMDVAMHELATLRAATQPERASINALILRAVAHTLRALPELNVVYAENGTIALPAIDIGVAIATQQGVFLPVLRGADAKSLTQIDAEVARLRAAAERRSLQDQDFAGTALSVSNLGMYGLDSFVAIISPPQIMMLAVGRVAQRPIVVDGALAIGSTMQCVLSCDHRVVDGVQAALFLSTLQRSLSDRDSIAR
jgi:pyruvate dehydrogenase E2 component (dihydrolipoamide acetyltransferase)